MARKKGWRNTQDEILDVEAVVLPASPLERMGTLSEMYPDLFPDVRREPRWKLPVKLLTILGSFLAVVGVIVYCFNGYVNLLTKATSQRAQIDTELQRRANLVPNLINVMETYAVYERQLVSHLAEVRAALVNEPPSMNQGGLRNASSGEPIQSLEEAISRLLAIVERYPDLKASATFQTLMTQLAETENRIAEQRGVYNRTARAYNNKLQSIPGNLLRYPFRLKLIEYFEAEGTVRKLPIVEVDLTQLQE